MDDKETLENLLKESPIPPIEVLQYLSRQFISPISAIANIKLLELYIGELTKTTEPQRRSQLYQIIAHEAQMIFIVKNKIPLEEVIHIGRITVEQFALANDWENIGYILIQSKRPEVALYAVEMAMMYEVPQGVVPRLKAYHALFDGRPSDAVNIAVEAKDADTLKSLSQYIPREQKYLIAEIGEHLWNFAKQGKLPMEEALSLAKRRGENLPAFAEALLAVAGSPYEKAIIANRYGVGDLGAYLPECAAELRGEIASLREQLQSNPAKVAERVDYLWKWTQVVNYRTHPEQSRQMDALNDEGRALKTDALMLLGKFEDAWHSAPEGHPNRQWLANLVELAKKF